MLKKNAQFFEGLFVASDLFVVSLSWIFAYWLRFSSELIPVDKGVPEFAVYLRLMLFVWLIWVFTFKRFGLYQSMRGSSRFKELLTLVRANLFAILVLLAVTYLFREKDVPFSRLVFVIFGITATLSTMLSRSVIRGVLRGLRSRGYNLRYALIVGAEDLAKQVSARLVAHPEYGVEVVGMLARDVRGRTPSAPRFMTQGSAAVQLSLSHEIAHDEANLPVVGQYDDLPRFIATGNIDQVIVALPLEDHNELPKVLASIGDSIVDVKLVPDYHKFIKLGSRVEEFDGLPFVNLLSTPLSGYNAIKKRAFDVVASSALLILFAPVLLLIALLVKLTSRGPIFFSQERVGLDGECFRIYKFRTMRVDAEAEGARFATKNDPRTTPIGKFLRRYSLDELPQLLNVLLGQMSLVGPRPERPVFIEEFRQHIPRYMLRHKVQAGMTGWAQVNGWRGNTSIEKRIECDLYYIENWSLSLDLKILGLTMWRGFTDRNAY